MLVPKLSGCGLVMQYASQIAVISDQKSKDFYWPGRWSQHTQRTRGPLAGRLARSHITLVSRRGKEARSTALNGAGT